MKKIIYLIFVFWIPSCTNCNKNEQKQANLSDSLMVDIKSNNIFDVEEATITDFLNAKKKYNPNFISDTLNYKKQNNKLILPISNNKTVIYIDTLSPESESTDYRIYNYLGHFPEIGYYIIQAGFYEYASFYLIDMKTGKENELLGFPKFSPKQSYLININEMGGMGDEQIGYQIWKFKKKEKSFIKIFEFDQFEWYPIDFIWENDNSAIIKVISFNSKDYNDGIDYKNSKDCVYKRLKIK